MSNIHLPATTEPSVSQEASERRAPLIPIGYVIAGVVVTLVVAVLSTALLVYLANNYACLLYTSRCV